MFQSELFYTKKNNLGKSQTFVFKGFSSEAMDYLTKGRKIHLKNNNKNGIIRSDNYLACIYAGQEKFGEALEFALKV